MAHYYCMMAGVPDLAMGGGGNGGMTLGNFREQCEEAVTDGDRRLLAYFYLKHDCLNVVRLLKASRTNDPKEDLSAFGVELSPWGNYTMEQYQDLVSSARTINFNVHRYPAFLSEFARNYAYNKERARWFADDEMLLAYYEYAVRCPNRLISSWYALNLDIANVLTALIARQQGWSVSEYVKGDTEVNEMIRTNSAKDFGLSHELDDMGELVRIVDVDDPVAKERRIDAFKWNWLDEHACDDIFSIEAVFAYLCKLEMLDRWERLDPAAGKAAFRAIIEQLRSGVVMPEEFRRREPARNSENTKTR